MHQEPGQQIARVEVLAARAGGFLVAVARQRAVEVESLERYLLALRHLFGFSEDALVAGAIGDGCTRCDAAAIAPVLEALLSHLDVDGNGAADPLTDGILILRYLFGFTGDSLISGAVDDDCTRCTAAQIEAYLDTLGG
ncbi:MAG TPA: hypothetical protein VNB06_22545 [Thermoanaerobaculia bacterium]|nr:hypothetical protein [Thermoanaerobaculia bacterium]